MRVLPQLLDTITRTMTPSHQPSSQVEVQVTLDVQTISVVHREQQVLPQDYYPILKETAERGRLTNLPGVPCSPLSIEGTCGAATS